MKYRRKDRGNWGNRTIFINKKEWQSSRQMRKTDKLCLSHHTHSSSVCCTSSQQLASYSSSQTGGQRISLETEPLHCCSSLLCSSIFRKTKTPNGNQKFTVDCLCLLQALLPGRFFSSPWKNISV